MKDSRMSKIPRTNKQFSELTSVVHNIPQEAYVTSS